MARSVGRPNELKRNQIATGSRLILIEGLPGSGKTSTAEWLYQRLVTQGLSASWAPEIQKDHPVIDRSTMRTASEPGYADRCIDRWDAFSTKAQTLDPTSVFVFEGCLFQSTVRFLIEYERPFGEAERYFAKIEESLAPLNPQILYLTQTDPEAYLHDELTRRKGKEIVSRIATYSATTPYAIRRELEGSSALVSLYVSYRRACDKLIACSSFPVLEVDAVRFGKNEVRDQVGAWTDAAIAG